MKYEIFDIQNALNACRSSLKTLNISETTTTGTTTAGLLMHSRSSSPIIAATATPLSCRGGGTRPLRNISTMAMASTTKLGAHRNNNNVTPVTTTRNHRRSTQQQQQQQRKSNNRASQGINVRLFEYGRPQRRGGLRRETSFDSMSLLSTTSSSNTTISYGNAAGLADKDFISMGTTTTTTTTSSSNNINNNNDEYCCYQSNYYPTTGTVYQPKPMIYSR